MSAMDFCIRSDLGATNRRHPVPGILRFCNYLQNVGATTCILGLQLSTFIFYNKHLPDRRLIGAQIIHLATPDRRLCRNVIFNPVVECTGFDPVLVAPLKIA